MNFLATSVHHLSQLNHFLLSAYSNECSKKHYLLWKLLFVSTVHGCVIYRTQPKEMTRVLRADAIEYILIALAL